MLHLLYCVKLLTSLKGFDLSMIYKRWKSILLLFATIPFIISIFLQEGITLFYLSNSYFYLSAPFLILGLFGLIFKDGTFDLFQYSWRKWKPSVFSQNNSKNDEGSEKNVQTLSQSIGNWYIGFLKIGGSLLAISLIFLIAYYII